MAGERAAGGWEILAEGGGTVARASEVADQVPLAVGSCLAFYGWRHLERWRGIEGGISRRERWPK